MTNLAELTNAHFILDAVRQVSEEDLDGLLKVVRWRRDVLPNSLIYRLLLSFSPTETADQSKLVQFLKSLRDASQAPVNHDEPTLDPAISILSRSEALRQCRGLRLRSIPEHAAISTESELANFVIEWAKRLELMNGAAQPPADFVEQFIEHDPDLRHWYETYLIPVLRLQYEFYPDNEGVIGVQDMERLSGAGGVKTLLQYAEREQKPSDIARDLDFVVGPWVRGASRAKRRKVEYSAEDIAVEVASWETVNDWLFSSSLTDFHVSAQAYVEWNGPVEDFQNADDTAARFAQTGLAIIYGCSESSGESQAVCREVLRKTSRLAGSKLPDLSKHEPDIVLPESFVNQLDETDLLSNTLRRRENRFTQVNESSLQLLFGLLGTSDILSDFGLPKTISDLARDCVFGSERRHKDELRRILQQVPRQTRKEIDWRSTRRQLLWLRCWTHTKQEQRPPGFLFQLSLNYMETQLLDAFLRASQFDVVKDVYLNTVSPPLPPTEVEGRVVAAIFEAYDNASNGNRDRGGMKRANDILKTFRPNFPQSSTFSDIDHLIRATHSLSFYQLTLQHGVPFKPVAIRVQKDPLTLVGKVLEQDSKAYTKLDDLLEIGRNLIRAHLPSRGTITEESEPLELRLPEAEQRITYLAIMAALAGNDFDTAYAYITTRLSSSPAQPMSSIVTDDTSWRAAYAAGKYRPNASPKNLGARIDSLAQRMELLSRALILAPSGESLSGILATWRRYEEEMDGLKSQAIDEEREFEAQADASLPGGFGLENRDADLVETKRAMARRSGPGTGTGPSYEEQAPLGLFDVARGAATALRKSAAFPLGSSGLRDLKIQSTTAMSDDGRAGHAPIPDMGEHGRVRKRDMVTNMVTSGLVSGMGWVLGAQPQDRVDHGGSELE